MTRVATFNVNGVNGRSPVLLKWLAETDYNIVCLQELPTCADGKSQATTRRPGLNSIRPRGTHAHERHCLGMSVPIEQISLYVTDGYNVVVETPRGSRTKFAYDPEKGLFLAKKLLALGFAFPFPFGFFPSTQAEDGDPLDVLLLTDAELPTGSLVRCRILGGIAIEQSSKGKNQRNDRLLAVPLLHLDRPPDELSDLPRAELNDVEDFLVAYQAADGKKAKVVRRLDKSEAEDVVRKAARP